jgi:hypothetical protein
MSRAVDDSDDLAFMQKPIYWPRWPYLPLKRPAKKGGVEHGFLLAQEGMLYFVNVGSIFSETDRQLAHMGKGVRLEYKDYDEIVADGWRVD